MFVISPGTVVQIHNIHKEEKPRRTKVSEELRFDSTSRTGFGGLFLYFRDGDWEIAVSRSLVQIED